MNKPDFKKVVSKVRIPVLLEHEEEFKIQLARLLIIAFNKGLEFAAENAETAFTTVDENTTEIYVSKESILKHKL